MKQVLLITGFLFVLSCIFNKVEGVTCKKCDDVDRPENCRVTINCGDGEICSTEEYTDVNRQQAYRLGCANAGRCRLFLNAKTLFGKRQTSPKCYECCETDNCNANLCQTLGGQAIHGGHITTVSPPKQVVHSSCNSGCPQMYVPLKDKCYFITPAKEHWMKAQNYCRQQGGNLVSVNSKEEHDFLKGLVNQVNASFVKGYWTGGFYAHEVGRFEYVDGSPFGYTQWYSGFPPTSYSQSTLYYVVLLNSVYSSRNRDLPMTVNAGSDNYGFICEIKRV